MRKAFTGLFVLALLAAAPAFADTSTAPTTPSDSARVANYFGTTGIFLAPTAYVQPFGQVSTYVGGTHDFISGGAVGGLGFNDRLEVGLNAIGLNHGPTFVSPNAKFQFIKENKELPAISAGVIDPFNQENRSSGTWYVVATKDLQHIVSTDFNFRATVGYGAGLYGDTIFAAGEFFLNKNLSAAAEYADHDFNVGARYYYKGWAGTLTLFDLSNFGGEISYNLRWK